MFPECALNFPNQGVLLLAVDSAAANGLELFQDVH
jgi:hypothetical protein